MILILSARASNWANFPSIVFVLCRLESLMTFLSAMFTLYSYKELSLLDTTSKLPKTRKVCERARVCMWCLSRAKVC